MGTDTAWAEMEIGTTAQFCFECPQICHFQEVTEFVTNMFAESAYGRAVDSLVQLSYQSFGYSRELLHNSNDLVEGNRHVIGCIM